ncbi:MAG: hypothetical protein Q8S84_04110 [bacterium]|nr:hypothetical protein [bacterium]MDP3380688.1 hypothetical protein [bacterium]
MYALELKSDNSFQLESLRETSNLYFHHHTFILPDIGLATKLISSYTSIFFEVLIISFPSSFSTDTFIVLFQVLSVDFNLNTLYHSKVVDFNLSDELSKNWIDFQSIDKSMS